MKISFQQYYFSLIVAINLLRHMQNHDQKSWKKQQKKTKNQQDFSPCVVKCSQPNGGERFIFRAASKATGVTLKNTVTDFSFNPMSLDHVRVMPGNKEQFFLQKGGDTNEQDCCWLCGLSCCTGDAHACRHARTHLKVEDWACADAALFFLPGASECSSCVRGYYCLYCARSQEPLSIHR